MLIKFTGPTITHRVVESYEWTKDNGHTTEVDNAELVANLLTLPVGEFRVADAEPLRQLDGMNDTLLIALAMEGVASVGDLSKLDLADKDLFTRLKVEAVTVRKWLKTNVTVVTISSTEEI